ncbi:repressor LexA [Cyanobacteria bacterium FACHB-471]|nr:repressor LexA [Cyanobacteria bacterium FACHB-471]
MEPLTEVQQRLLDWLEEYIFQHNYSPSTRQLREAIGWKSVSAVRYHLKKLREKGWLDWSGSHSRAYQLLSPKVGMVPIWGTISAHSLTEVFPDQEVERINLFCFPQFRRMSVYEVSQCFALRVRGDSMIGALIDNGDVVIMKPPSDQKAIKNGTIVAARVEGKTTLKCFFRKLNTVTLKPANPMYPPTNVNVSVVDIQGVYVGLVRDLI